MLKKISIFAAKIGKDLSLVQGGGGNISIKRDGIMWIKASGKWMANANNENIFVSVNDIAIREAIKKKKVDPVTKYVGKGQMLRPSIETTLHALLPHQVVLHVHSANVISWAARKDGKKRLIEKLKGLKWEWIDYCQPGLPLTNAASKAMHTLPDVLILANHGLVVGGESCNEVESLLHEVEARLSNNKNHSPKADYGKLNAIATKINYIPVKSEDVHSIATNLKKLRIADQGVLYPDHAVFLGGELSIVRNFEQTASVMKGYKDKYGKFPVVLYIENAGVLISKDIAPEAEAMLFALASVLIRMDLSVEYNYLSDKDVSRLMNWEAEKYRQTINH